MEVIDGQWFMNGIDWDDERCLHSPGELLELVEKTGFLPLFSNRIEGFSVEEVTDPQCWWTGDEDTDPWEWRVTLARTGKVAYGKFFGNKAGFVSKKWFPYLANLRRDGYDFDAAYEDGKAGYREKLLMDLFVPQGADMWDITKSSLKRSGCADRLFTYEMKEKAGFGKGGEKNFDGVLSRLQMKTYLIPCDFRPRLNKNGESFGWSVAVMTPPEYLWGYRFVTGRYGEPPEDSLRKIVSHIEKHFAADAKTIRKLLK